MRPKPYEPRRDEKHKAWEVAARSILLYNFFKRAKEEGPRIVWPYIEKYPLEACRGFFDAEGSVVVDDHLIEASNYDRRLLEMIKELLGKLDIQARIRHKHLKGEYKCGRTGKTFRPR